MKSAPLAVALTLVLAGCGGGAQPDPRSAQRMKQDVDAAVLDLAPRLTKALDGEIRAAGGEFLTCQMSSDEWKYSANIGLTGVTPDADAVTSALEDAGYGEVDLSGQGATRRVTASRGPVTVDIPLGAGQASVSNVAVLVDCTPLDDAGQTFAEDDPGEDYDEVR